MDSLSDSLRMLFKAFKVEILNEISSLLLKHLSSNLNKIIR